jgi:hypothetical protein
MAFYNSEESSDPLNSLDRRTWGHRIKDGIGGFDKLTNSGWQELYRNFYNVGASPEDTLAYLGFNAVQMELF